MAHSSAAGGSTASPRAGFAPSPRSPAGASDFTAFFSFAWKRGLPVAQVLHDALRASAPEIATWFALEQDAASPTEMAAGVAASRAFVFFATDGALLRPNVRHEVACAMRGGKPLVVLLEEGLTLSRLLEQAAAYRQADPEEDASVGKLHLDSDGTAAFARAAKEAGEIAFFRDERLLSCPRCLQRCAALQGGGAGFGASPHCPLPRFRMPALRCAEGGCDALLVGGTSGALQLLYLSIAAQAECGARALSLRTAFAPPPQAGAALALGAAPVPAAQYAEVLDAAVKGAAAVVLVLTQGVWAEPHFVAAALAAHGAGKRVVLVHEEDCNFEGVVRFEDIQAATPANLQPLYSSAGTAIKFRRKRAEAALMLGDLLLRIGAVPFAPALPPPPPPSAYNDAPTTLARRDALERLLANPAPLAVFLCGVAGAGKSTVATSLAQEGDLVRLFDDVLWVPSMGREGVPGVLEKLLGALDPAGDGEGARDCEGARGGEGSGDGEEEEEGSEAEGEEGGGEGGEAGAGGGGGAEDEEAEEASPAPSAPARAAGPLASAVQRLRAVCARRAVLIIADDIKEPELAEVLMECVAVCPLGAWPASRALFTCRDARAHGCALAVGGRGGVEVVDLGKLEAGCAERFLVAAAQLQPEGSGELLEGLLKVIGRTPFALSLAAASLRATLLQGGSEAAAVQELVAVVTAPQLGPWLCQQDFRDALQYENSLCESPEYAPGFCLLQAVLSNIFGKVDVARFAILALFEDVGGVPEGVLSLAWALSPAATQALLLCFQDAGLVKWERQVQRAVLHDLARDFAAALLWAPKEKAAAARRLLVQRCEGLEAEVGAAGCWWRAQLPVQLRSAGLGHRLTQKIWQLDWLIQGVRERGGGAVTREVGEQLAWLRSRLALEAVEVNQAHSLKQAAGELGLLHQTLVLAVSSLALVGAEGADNVAAQVLGRLGVREGGLVVGGELCAGLVAQALAWDGGGRRWLRPVCSTLAAPGGPYLAVMAGHGAAVLCVCALSSGVIVSGASDCTLRAWDAGTGTCCWTQVGHKEEVITGLCEVLPVPEEGGGLIVSGSTDKCLRVRRCDTGSSVGVVLRGHTGGVTSVCALGDGRVVSGSADGTLRIWRAVEGTQLVQMPCSGGVISSVTCVCVLDGRIVSGSRDGQLRMWDAGNGALLSACVAHKRKEVTSVCAGGGGRLVSGSNDGALLMWDTTVAPWKSTKCKGHEGAIRSLAVQGGTLVSASLDRKLRFWDGAGKCVKAVEVYGSAILCLCVLQDGRIVSGSDDKVLRVWDGTVDADARGRLPPQGHRKAVTCACVLDENHVVSGSEDHTLRVWEKATGKCVRVLEGHTKAVLCVAAHKGVILSGSRDKTVREWDLSSASHLWPNRVEPVVHRGNTHDVMAVLPHMFGGKVLRACERRLLWGDSPPLDGGHKGTVEGLCLASLKDGLAIVSASQDNTLRVWVQHIQTGNFACSRVLKGHSGKVLALFAPFPQIRGLSGMVACASDDGFVRVWDADAAENMPVQVEAASSERGKELLWGQASGTLMPAALHCGSTRAHFKPWGGLPVHLGADAGAFIRHAHTAVVGANEETGEPIRASMLGVTVFTLAGTAHTFRLEAGGAAPEPGASAAGRGGGAAGYGGSRRL